MVTVLLLLMSMCVNVVLAVALFYKRQARNWVAGMKDGEASSSLVFHRPEFRRFVLNRKIDVTGISGTGVRVEGVVFSDGYAVSHWLDMPPMNEPKTEVWHNLGVDPLLKISGHNGASELVWIDGT
jgi:hypothetical protein